MDNQDQVSSGRKVVDDPFLNSARKRVEWSRERKPAYSMDVDKLTVSKIPSSRVLNLNQGFCPTPTVRFPSNGFFFSFNSMSPQNKGSPPPTKNLDIDELCEKSNPAYRTYDNSLQTKKSRLFDTPPTNPTENRLALSSSLAASQASISHIRDSRSWLLGDSNTPQLKQSQIPTPQMMQTRVSDFQVIPQTPKHRTIDFLKNSTAQFSLLLAGKQAQNLPCNSNKPRDTATISQTPEKQIQTKRDRPALSSSIDVRSLTLRGTPQDYGNKTYERRIAAVKYENSILDKKIDDLKKQLQIGEVTVSHENLELMNKRLIETQTDMELVTNAIESLTAENALNAKRLQFLHQMALSSNFRTSPEECQRLANEGTHLRQRLQQLSEENKQKIEQKVAYLKSKCLKQLENESKFVKYKYAVDRKAMINDMQGYIAFLEERKASRQLESNRPSYI